MGYKFSPRAGKSNHNLNKKQRFTKFESGSNLTSLKKPAFIASILAVLAIMVFASPQITGNLLLSSEDKALADDPNFPDLPAFEANKELFLCRNTLSTEQGQLSQYEYELDTKATTLEACLQEKNSLIPLYDDCAASLSPCQNDLSACIASKEILSQNAQVCSDELIVIKQDLSDYQLDTHSIRTNYADSWCCTYRSIMGDNIKYYKFENNEVICTEDSDDEEFNWEDC